MEANASFAQEAAEIRLQAQREAEASRLEIERLHQQLRE